MIANLIIEGHGLSHGHITACDGVFSIYVCCRSPRHWGFAERQLAFCQVSQDGDEACILQLDRLPNSDEAELIRHYCIRQTRQVSAETIERVRAHQKRFESGQRGDWVTGCAGGADR